MIGTVALIIFNIFFQITSIFNMVLIFVFPSKNSTSEIILKILRNNLPRVLIKFRRKVIRMPELMPFHPAEPLNYKVKAAFLKARWRELPSCIVKYPCFAVRIGLQTHVVIIDKYLCSSKTTRISFRLLSVVSNSLHTKWTIYVRV